MFVFALVILEIIFACIIFNFDELVALSIFSTPILWLGAFGGLMSILFVCVLIIKIKDCVKGYSNLEEKKTFFFLSCSALGCIGAVFALFNLFSFRFALFLFIQWPVCFPLIKTITRITKISAVTKNVSK